MFCMINSADRQLEGRERSTGNKGIGRKHFSMTMMMKMMKLFRVNEPVKLFSVYKKKSLKYQRYLP
jgi:hypothetical protein